MNAYGSNTLLSYPFPNSSNPGPAYYPTEAVPNIIDPTTYKTEPCQDYRHQGAMIQECHYYHSEQDKRRPPYLLGMLMYSTEMCPDKVSFGYCMRGDSCDKCHNYFEKFYHPNVSPKIDSPEKLDYCQIDINTYKVKLCTILVPHDFKLCDFYHSIKDRRRIPTIYSSDKCEYFDSDKCPNYDVCPYAHNMLEKFYHPEKYKTRLCNIQKSEGTCKYERICCFAHTEDELTIYPIHKMPQDEMFYMYYFKTVWCPFNEDHNRASCVYAHNWQDFRRRPHIYSYRNKLCPNWKYNNFLCQYEDGCPLKAACSYCHGWKELLFHPLEYKKKVCPYGKKCRMMAKVACPYFHSEKESRVTITSFEIPSSKLSKLNPYNNINDQMEIYYESYRELKIDFHMLHYTSFEDEVEKGFGKTDAFARPLKNKMESNPLPQVNDCKDPLELVYSRINSMTNLEAPKNPKKNTEDVLYKILMKADLLKHYFILRDRITNKSINFLKSLVSEDLIEYGILANEERTRLLQVIRECPSFKLDGI
jgi:hypothetical protein